MALTMEAIQDIYTIVNLYRVGNLFEMAYFLGKGFVNLFFYILSVVVSILWWNETYLKTIDATSDEEGQDELTLLTFCKDGKDIKISEDNDFYP